ncbi:MAG TPA: MFS transporter, partial [Balneolales bacterium]|nr:MFS transporter [Balneolales bacterium]
MTFFKEKSPERKSAIKFIIFLGFVSLFADVTYEGARSIVGPYIGMLGADATVVGVVIGLGELIGYGFRIIAGYIVDKTGRYWLITIIGYAINLFAVPALAVAGNWQMAAALIIAERFGKSVRAPARDAMLSGATSVTGHGAGFGLHEAMDQIGAVLGPALMAFVLFYNHNYRLAFASLLIPALVSLVILLAACFTYRQPMQFEKPDLATPEVSLSRNYKLFIFASAFIALGFADFPLIAFHFKQIHLFSDGWIPLTYALAMGVDAVTSLVLGPLFDRYGFKIPSYSILITTCSTPLLFIGGQGL